MQETRRTEKRAFPGPAARALALEPRIMFDGAGLLSAADIADAAPGTVADIPDEAGSAGEEATSPAALFDGWSAPADNPFAGSRATELVLIDAGVADPATLAAAVPPGADVRVLAADRDPIGQISEILAGRRGIEAIHLVSHGDAGTLAFAGGTVDGGTLETRADEIRDWGAALSREADILVYGCDVGAGDAGAAFTGTLARLAGADVASSTDATGPTARGGDWVLERSTGRIETATLVLPTGEVLETIPPSTERVSVDSSGAEGDALAGDAAISSDGRYVAFYSNATNLVAGDTNGARDIFVHDRQSGTTERVSVHSDGTAGNSGSFDPAISPNGRYVAFRSYATNLVAGDTNGTADIFVHDRETGTTERVSVDSVGTEGDDASYYPVLSSDGRYVAFQSDATNLVAGDTNATKDIFVHDRQSGTTERVSVDSSGTEGNGNAYGAAISADGRYVAFRSNATNLVAGDTNGSYDIFVHDRQSGTTERVSVDSSGTEGNDNSYDASISSDGRYVAFRSLASNLVAGDTNVTYDIFVHDRQNGTTERVSVDSSGTEGDGSSYYPAISPNGQYVAFRSAATNLVSGDTNGAGDVFIHDRQSGTTERVSVDSSGTEGNATSTAPAISSGGRYVAFQSDATNLVAGDTNAVNDIFVRDRGAGTEDQAPPPPPPPPENTTEPVPEPPADDTTSDTTTETTADSGDADLTGDSGDDTLTTDTDTTAPAPDPGAEQAAPPPDAVAAVSQNIAQAVEAMGQSELSMAEQKQVLKTVGGDAIVEGLANSADPVARDVGQALARVKQGENVSHNDIKRQLERQGVDRDTMMTYLMAYQQVRKEARTELFSEALKQIREGGVTNPFTRPPPQGDVPALGDKVAIMIGNEAYGGAINPLNTPVADITSIGRIFEERFGYDTIQLRNATYSEMVGALMRIGGSLQPEQSLVVYYAGHGYLMEETDTGYWLPTDAEPGNADKWISTKDIADFLSKVKSKQIMVISDSCYSGTLTREYQLGTEAAGLSPEEIRQRRSVMVMSSGGEEPVFDDGYPGHSVFAGNLIEALKQTPDDERGFDVFAEVKGDVVEAVPQTPTYGALLSAGHDTGGDFIFDPR